MSHSSWLIVVKILTSGDREGTVTTSNLRNSKLTTNYEVKALGLEPYTRRKVDRDNVAGIQQKSQLSTEFGKEFGSNILGILEAFV